MPLILSSLMLYWLYNNTSFLENTSIVENFILASLASVAMGLALIPTSLVALVGGYFWGWISLPILIFTYLLATILGHFLSKKIDNEQILHEINKNIKAKKLLLNLKTDQFKLIVLARLSPVFPFGISNVVFTYLGVGLRQLILAGLLGMFPRTIFMVWLAINAATLKEIINVDYRQQLSSPIFIIGLLSVVLIVLIIYKAYKKAN